MKSVHFDKAAKAAAAAGEARPAKRSVKDRDADEPEDELTHKRGKKRSRMERPNEDEMDDVDDWVEEDDERVGGLTERQKMEAKRARRQKRHHSSEGDDDESDGENGGGVESTKIDRTTSLAAEGITVEPFNMENEKSDGSGYFDGDTYVFRNRDSDDEPDAWLDGLKDTDSIVNKSAAVNAANGTGSDDLSLDEDDLSKEQLYAKILPLVSDTETIMQAVVRYGSLLKRQPLSRKKKETTDADDKPLSHQSESFEFARVSLNDLTEASAKLLNLGDVDIYQKTRNDLLTLIPKEYSLDHTQNASVDEQNTPSALQIRWEYKGSQDGKMHGPYTSDQMKAWIKAGYFVGEQAVQVRSIQEKSKSDVQDLLSDLMDDGDGDNGDQVVRGDWISSEKADF